MTRRASAAQSDFLSTVTFVVTPGDALTVAELWIPGPWKSSATAPGETTAESEVAGRAVSPVEATRTVTLANSVLSAAQSRVTSDQSEPGSGSGSSESAGDRAPDALRQDVLEALLYASRRCAIFTTITRRTTEGRAPTSPSPREWFPYGWLPSGPCERPGDPPRPRASGGASDPQSAPRPRPRRPFGHGAARLFHRGGRAPKDGRQGQDPAGPCRRMRGCRRFSGSGRIGFSSIPETGTSPATCISSGRGTVASSGSIL